MAGRFYLILISFFLFYGIDATFAMRVSSILQFTITDGLSHNSVNVIFQDSRGFLWIGTEDGLNRYDGSGFKIFRHDPERTDGMSGNQVVAIAEDLDGNIWVGTRDRGITVLCPLSHVFKTFRHQSNDANSIPEDGIYAIHVTDEGTVWVKTRRFLSRYSLETNDFQSFGHYVNIFQPSQAYRHDIIKETDTTFLVGTSDGLNRFFINDETFERLRASNISGGIFQEPILQILKVESDNFLVATKTGLKYFLPRDNLLVQVETPGMPGGRISINALLADRHGAVWIGTGRGLEKFDQHRLVSQVIEIDRKGIFPALDCEVTTIIEDSSGILWVGTRFNGLFKINPVTSPFSYIGEGAGHNWNMQSFNARSIFIDSNGTAWIGTFGAGLYKVDTHQGVLNHFVINPQGYISRDDVVESIFEDLGGNLWIGTNSGLYIMNRNTMQPREFYYGFNMKFATLLRNNLIKEIEMDSAGTMWFGTLFGLYSYNNGRMDSFFEGDQVNGILADEINALHLDKAGRLWIGTSKGINYLEPISGTFLTITGKGSNHHFDRNVLSLATDLTGQLWVGTRTGMYRFSGIEKDSALITPVPVMENEMITAIVVDKNNKVWVSSSRGLSKILDENTVRGFDLSDGIPVQVFNIGSAVKASTGELFFGSTTGFNWIHPDSLKINQYTPKVAITRVLACHRGVCDPLNVNSQGELTVRFRSGMSLDISFAALEFTQPLRNSYKVMLEGYDDDWRPASTRNTATFANLSPGRYTLKIMASNNDLAWNPNPVEMAIVVKPPMWMTNAAFLFYLLAVIFMIQAIINYRVRYYRKANRLLNETSLDKVRLEGQRKELSLINQNLTDSINYARRIQSAMIPDETSFKRLFPHSFVYFRPKEMVSGDFYWFHEQRGKIFVAVVDCTGHGVPGAFMSIIGMDILKNIVLNSGSDSPATLLKLLNKELDNTLRQDDNPVSASRDVIKDGMDIVIIVIDRERRTMDFGGLVNDLYLVRDNELQTFRGDRPQVFRVSNGDEPEFNETRVDLNKDDVIYMFTDGYADQFGGVEEKKFKYRRFRHLLLNIHSMTPVEQKAILHRKFEDWRGGHEQVDDVLVIGIKPF